MKDAQSKLDRLSENNKLLIMELEEKRALSQEISKKYQNLHKENGELRNELRQAKKEATSVGF
jgi:peptidoglycan hydrolase CwlO-like protein